MATEIKTQHSFPEAERILLDQSKPNCDLVKRYHDALAECEKQLQAEIDDNVTLNEELDTKQERIAQLTTRLREQSIEIIEQFKAKLLKLVSDWTKIGHNSPHGVMDNAVRIVKQAEL